MVRLVTAGERRVMQAHMDGILRLQAQLSEATAVLGRLVAKRGAHKDDLLRLSTAATGTMTTVYMLAGGVKRFRDAAARLHGPITPEK